MHRPNGDITKIPPKDIPKHDPVESAGLLNMALAGLQQVLGSPLGKGGHWERSERQTQQIKELMDGSDSVKRWVLERVTVAEEERGEERPGLTVSEAWSDYVHFCSVSNLYLWQENAFRKSVKALMIELFGRPEAHDIERPNGLKQRGWRKIKLK